MTQQSLGAFQSEPTDPATAEPESETTDDDAGDPCLSCGSESVTAPTDRHGRRWLACGDCGARYKA